MTHLSLGLFSATRLIAISAALIAAISSVALGAQEPTRLFPTIEGESVSGKSVKFPASLSADRTIVFAAYSEEQQKDVDTWVSALRLKQRNIPFIELAVLGKTNPFFQSLILTAMRRGLPSKADQDRTIVTFVEGDEFRRKLGLTGDGKYMHVLVVDQRAVIRLTADGPYSAATTNAVLIAANSP